ncbi:MAG: uroporphyrinogen-III C-methyltransferase [Dehalococcoidia bacterium]
MAEGKVWLVGAGPGDPGLLTIKGADVLGQADAVVYDRLVNPAFLERVPPECERIYAGKEPGGDPMSQTAINELMVRLGKAGKRVVRLKGGDPFVFGRGGEEAQALHDAGLPFEVIPGVSSAIAVPAYAGIPVSQRGIATSFAVVTGHEDPDKCGSDINWAHLALGVDTLVFLMGVGSLTSIAEQLLAAGRSPETPVAVIHQGTTTHQRSVTGVLSDIAQRVQDARLTAPSVTVVGEVVRLRETLAWFETRPLFGKRILITRTRHQSSNLRGLLEADGAEVVELPTLEIVDGASPELINRVIAALGDGQYAWVIFTSANAVRRFFHYLRESGHDARAFHSQVAVIGPGTSDALAEFGIRADAMPQDYVGEGLLQLLSAHELARRRVLLPRAEGARPELIQGLRAQGAEVEEVPLYSSEVPRNPDPSVLSQIDAGTIDAVTFASSSAVRNLVKMLGGDAAALRKAAIACIGPITAWEAERCGLTVAVTAAEHSVPGLVEGLRRYFRSG